MAFNEQLIEIMLRDKYIKEVQEPELTREDMNMIAFAKYIHAMSLKVPLEYKIDQYIDQWKINNGRG